MNNEINMCTNFVAFFPSHPLAPGFNPLVRFFGSWSPFWNYLIGFSTSSVQHSRAAEKYVGKGTNDLWPSSKLVFSPSTNILRRSSITCSDCESLASAVNKASLAMLHSWWYLFMWSDHTWVFAVLEEGNAGLACIVHLFLQIILEMCVHQDDPERRIYVHMGNPDFPTFYIYKLQRPVLLL